MYDSDGRECKKAESGDQFGVSPTYGGGPFYSDGKCYVSHPKRPVTLSPGEIMKVEGDPDFPDNFIIEEGGEYSPKWHKHGVFMPLGGQSS